MEKINSAAEKTAKAEMPEVKKAETDSIFTLVKDKDGVKICIGNYLISKNIFKTWKDAENYLKSKPYEIIINAACLFADKTKSNKK